MTGRERKALGKAGRILPSGIYRVGHFCGEPRTSDLLNELDPVGRMSPRFLVVDRFSEIMMFADSLSSFNKRTNP